MRQILENLDFIVSFQKTPKKHRKPTLTMQKTDIWKRQRSN